ncbi:MAG: hypothetical protein QOI20_2748 [Acidimicrobiaceae bacterium]|nr:hypothetical protein [Acidimicrobiaceae bacterium]
MPAYRGVGRGLTTAASRRPPPARIVPLRSRHFRSRLLALAGALTLMSAPAGASPFSGRLPHVPLPPVDASAVGDAAAAAGPSGPGPGYWVAAADGGVFAYGRAHFEGSAAGTPLRRAVAAVAATPSGLGYWMAAKDGGVFAYGDAAFLGAAAGKLLNSSVVAMASSPTGRGYWLAASDGGVFAFGDAAFKGSLAGTRLNQPIVGLASTPSGLGYWLVAKDGGVFAFGDAGYFGGAAGTPLHRGVVGIAATPFGLGYWLVGADGGVFSYGDAGYFGSAIGANPTAPIVGLATTASGRGYWLAGADGGVFAYGDAGFYGAPVEDGSRSRVVGLVAGSGTDVRTQAQSLTGTFGWDISWPQCGARLPGGGYAFGIVGVTKGHQFSENPCLAAEYRWALRHGSMASLYMNVNWPSKDDEPRLDEQYGDVCKAHELPCQLYWWGRRGAAAAVAVANAHHVSAPMWWLDVETTNRWSPDPRLNLLIVKGAKEGLEAAKLRVGLYSSQYQWNVITAGYAPGLPTWVAGPKNAAEAPAACAPERSFGGGTPWLVQFPNGLDGNILCPAGAAELLSAFRAPAPPAVPAY